MDITKKILDCPSLPGASEKMTSVIKEEFEKYSCDFTVDALSNAFFTKTYGEGKHIMVCCGIDIGGVIATSISGSKIYVSALGNCKDIRTCAYSKVVFDNISGVLIPPDGYTNSTNISDCYVETYDSNASEKVQPGTKGYFDIPLNFINDNILWGYGAGEKMCISTVVSAASALFSNKSNELMKEQNIGKVTAAFLGQHSLMSRGSAVAANALCPDEIIFVSPFDLGNEAPNCKYVIKISDKSYTSDSVLLQKVCGYFDKNSISYTKRVTNELSTAIINLSHAPSIPSCVEICLAVYNKSTVLIK